MSVATALLAGCITAFGAGLIGWLLSAKPVEDPMQEEIGVWPNVDDWS